MSQPDDPAIAQIEALSRVGRVPTYAWLKSHFGSRQISEDVYRSLNRGRGILQTIEQLDQYLFSYAPMVASQWQHASKFLLGRAADGDARLIDYGCGQGLAGLLLHDQLGGSFLADARTIVAVEPSAVALRRASAIYRCLAPHSAVIAVNKTFDTVQSSNLPNAGSSTTHIFSNVLDIDGYDHFALLRKGLGPGMHTIIALGHDRTRHGYSQGLQRVREAVETGSARNGITLRASEQESFACGNRGEPALLWLCKLEVSRG